MAQVAPKLVAPDLIDEIDVGPAVAVHVCHRHAIAMIVMDGFVVFGPVIHGTMFKAYAALLVSIGELEIVKNFPTLGGLNLLLFVFLERTERIGAQIQRVVDFPVNSRVRSKQGAG